MAALEKGRVARHCENLKSCLDSRASASHGLESQGLGRTEVAAAPGLAPALAAIALAAAAVAAFVEAAFGEFGATVACVAAGEAGSQRQPRPPPLHSRRRPREKPPQ